ncbi:hypothetical protein E1B28_006349 [Marasmius oreades]|uniref:FAD-binding PCMH-type domain-containing protein n=1 Tax=Marasmius oreades TaxID=181124 RepID=A0A9P7S5F2_9AGAR|nr:uncharacterized protein E1B28_006349 [Marasmius oreades]KAG7095625.1 hypothetical protein E1B28_006349 [Marasmius oreades]
MLAYAVLAIVHYTFFLSTHAHSAAEPRVVDSDGICSQIENAISSASDVYYFGELSYFKDIGHWASSSSQLSLCSVEPGTAQDVGIILGILGTTQTPFAVKGGGHTANPGFSSTNGVQISMSRFSEVTYDAQSQTVVIGTGITWDDVYAALAPHNVNVVGGRVSGVGVAGFTLGGGYSWLSNQYGMTVDTVTAFELVKPDGAVVTVTESSDADLFFALRGGMNNFGIVTRFTLKTFPQGQVWGGLITYVAHHVDDVTKAAATFSATVTDPKASIITTYNFVLGSIGISQLLFYDGPTVPDGIFDDFLAIPHFTKNVKTRDFLDLVKTPPSDITIGQRGIFHTVPLLEITPAILEAVVNETMFWGSRLSLLSGNFISYQVEPFLPGVLSHASSPSAYPPSRSVMYLPFNVYYAWTFSFSDSKFHDTIRASVQHLTNVAVAEGQSGVETASPYPNYAMYDTPVTRIYGENLGRLQSVKARVDPSNIMRLTGGFKV